MIAFAVEACLATPRLASSHVDTQRQREEISPPQRPVSVCYRAEVSIARRRSTLLSCVMYGTRPREVYCSPSPSALLDRRPDFDRFFHSFSSTQIIPAQHQVRALIPIMPCFAPLFLLRVH